jgi:hypothetical protein
VASGASGAADADADDVPPPEVLTPGSRVVYLGKPHFGALAVVMPSPLLGTSAAAPNAHTGAQWVKDWLDGWVRWLGGWVDAVAGWVGGCGSWQ